jgi:dihydrofolate reductase
MNFFGIVATINNNIISFKKDNKNYVSHINGYTFFPEKEKEQLLNFAMVDKKIFSSYIDEIKDGSIIVIGQNTFNDAFGLFKRILKNKTITFILSNVEEIKTISYLKDKWETPILIDTNYIKNLNKEDSKNKLLKLTEKESSNSKSDVHVMGGKSVYEAFSGKYNDLIVNNINIDENVIRKMQDHQNIVFNKVRL